MNRLCPFKWFVLQNFPFIEEDFDAITNYQLLCKVVEYLNKTIDKTNELGVQVEALNNWFNNLDVQDEINNKLDEMVEDGTLAEIINQQIFQELNTAIQNNTNDINDIKNEIKTYPFYDMLKNGGYSDGTTANDTIFNNAKNDGYRKFYFSQNENNNANYYFNSTPNFNDCEIMTDDGVILNFPDTIGINNLHNGKYITNINLFSRIQNKIFPVPANISDFFNQFYLPKYEMKNQQIRRIGDTNLKLFAYDYYNSKLFVDHTTNINNFFSSEGYTIRSIANLDFSLLCVPASNNKCVEIVALPNSHITFGCVDSNSNMGIYSSYNGSASDEYFFVDGSSSSSTTNNACYSNLFAHNGQYSNNNNYDLYMKYKLRLTENKKALQLYVNDIFVSEFPTGANIDYFGFGLSGSPTSQNGFSDPLEYEQTNVPLNSSINMLIAGDSRMYGYNSQYHIEDVINNGLENNGVNLLNIDNISVSGWTIHDVEQALLNINLSNYDIVLIPIGINNAHDTYDVILQKAYDIMDLCKNNHCFTIFPATIPVGFGGSDIDSTRRSENYYKIQQAILSASGYISGSKRLVQISPNIMGTTILSNNIEVCSDGVHPTQKGTILFAKHVVNSILHILD